MDKVCYVYLGCLNYAYYLGRSGRWNKAVKYFSVTSVGGENIFYVAIKVIEAIKVYHRPTPLPT